MALSTVTIHPTKTVWASFVPSSTPTTASADNPKNSGLYPNGHGYGIAVWIGIASAMFAAILILIYMGWVTYKSIKRTRARRSVIFISFNFPEFRKKGGAKKRDLVK